MYKKLQARRLGYLGPTSAVPPNKSLHAPDRRNTAHCFFVSNLRYVNKQMVKTEGTHRPETVHLTELCSEPWLLSTLNEQRSFAASSSLGRPYIVQTTTRPAHASPDAMTLLHDAGCTMLDEDDVWYPSCQLLSARDQEGQKGSRSPPAGFTGACEPDGWYPSCPPRSLK
jgi:hypothetical protein